MMLKYFKLNQISSKNARILISIMGLLAVIFVAIVISFESRLTKLQIASYEQKNIDQMKSSFSNEMINSMNIAKSLSTVDIFELPSPFTPNEYITYNNMRKQINSITQINEYISQVAIKNGSNNYTTDYGNTYDVIMQSKTQSLGKMGNMEFDNTVDFGYIINQSSSISNVSKIIFRINMTLISKRILSDTTEGRIQCVVDSDGVIVVSLRGSDIGKRIDEVYNTDFNSDCIAKRTSFSGKEYFFSSGKIENFDLYAVSFTDWNWYGGYTRQNILICIAIIIIFLLAIITVTLLISNITYKPFKKIASTIGIVEQDSMIKDNNQLNYIIQSIQKIKENNTALNESVVETLNELRAQQMIACQAQICPHFISNTLSAVNCISVSLLKDNNNEISLAVRNLAEILRSTLEVDTLITDIRNEINMTQKYIEILYLRYDKSFTVKWNVDENLLDYYIIKFSLQPIIENAASHAFTGMEKQQIIDINIFTNEGNIIVEITDNGIGIDAERLNKIRNNMNDFNNINSHNIGLKNVNHRIKLLYGNEYGLKIESIPRKGTKFSFSFPAELF